MSAAAAAAAAPTADAPAGAGSAKPPNQKKKRLVIGAAALVLLLLIGGGAVVYLKKKNAQAAALAEDGGTAAATEHTQKPDLKHPPTFLPLDPFVVNLADRQADRYAQIGITLEVEDAKFAEQMKNFMPAIRNAILMILAHKSSQELLARSGKEQLADEVLRAASKTMGLDVAPAPATDTHAAADDGDDDADEAAAPKGKGKGKAKAAAKGKPAKPASEPNPIRRVHFANFIIQ